MSCSHGYQEISYAGKPQIVSRFILWNLWYQQLTSMGFQTDTKCSCVACLILTNKLEMFYIFVLQFCNTSHL
jgi:hypothetical protein